MGNPSNTKHPKTTYSFEGIKYLLNEQHATCHTSHLQWGYVSVFMLSVAKEDARFQTNLRDELGTLAVRTLNSGFLV